MKKLTILLALLASCSPDSSSESAAPKPETPPAPAAKDLITYVAPSAWIKEEPENRLRLAQYRVPDKQKQAADAECTLSHFANRSVDVDGTVSMWSTNMGGAEAKVRTIEGKCKVTIADYSGNYNSGFGKPFENARMLGAIVEASDGPWYFKLVGPIETVSGWHDEFVAMVKGATR
jgi:hypothetical protein